MTEFNDEKMKRRWLFYLLAGLLFGVFDFYYQVWVSSLYPKVTLSNLGMIVIVLAVWLLLVVPIALCEAKSSRSIWLVAFASAFTWTISVIAYYLFMAIKLFLIGEPGRAELHISNRDAPYYWSNFKNVLVGDVLGGISEWIVVSLVGGSLIGLLIGFLGLRPKKSALRPKK